MSSLASGTRPLPIVKFPNHDAGPDSLHQKRIDLTHLLIRVGHFGDGSPTPTLRAGDLDSRRDSRHSRSGSNRQERSEIAFTVIITSFR